MQPPEHEEPNHKSKTTEYPADFEEFWAAYLPATAYAGYKDLNEAWVATGRLEIGPFREWDRAAADRMGMAIMDAVAAMWSCGMTAEAEDPLTCATWRGFLEARRRSLRERASPQTGGESLRFPDIAEALKNLKKPETSRSS